MHVEKEDDTHDLHKTNTDSSSRVNEHEKPTLPVWTMVTVTYNSERQLRDYWSQKLPPNVEWIVVDNASTDGTIREARRAGAKIIASRTNLGFGAANNLGLAAARGSYIGFVNPDVTVDFSSLEAMQAAIDESGGIVAPQLVNDDGSLQPGGRGFPTLKNKILNRLSEDDEHERYRIYCSSDESRYVCWAIGAAVAGTKGAFTQLGGWDEKFFLYYEDSDIGLRAWNSGLTYRLLGNARWVHGWARETTGLRWAPWKREIASMAKFYARYPKLLWSERYARKSYPAIAEALTVAPTGHQS